MLGLNYYTYGTLASRATGTGVWTIVSIILAIVGGLVLYFTFLSKKNEGKFTGFLGWMYEFLNFKKMTIEHILKVTYLILAIFVTLNSFNYIGIHFGIFVVTLIGENLLLRIIYEFSLVLLAICRNTTEINNKMKKD